MLVLYFREFLSLMFHFLCQFEKGLFIAVLIVPMCQTGTIFVDGRSIVFFEVLDVQSKLLYGVVFQSDGLLEM